MRPVHTDRSEVYRHSNSYGISVAIIRLSIKKVAGIPDSGSGLKNIGWSVLGEAYVPS